MRLEPEAIDILCILDAQLAVGEFRAGQVLDCLHHLVMAKGVGHFPTHRKCGLDVGVEIDPCRVVAFPPTIMARRRGRGEGDLREQVARASRQDILENPMIEGMRVMPSPGQSPQEGRCRLIERCHLVHLLPPSQELFVRRLNLADSVWRPLWLVSAACETSQLHIT